MKLTLQLIRMVGKLSIHLFVISAIIFNSVLASKSGAQNILSVKEARISVTIDQLSLEETFDLIESNSDYKFVYKYSELNKKIRLSMSPESYGSSMENLLLSISREANVSFKQVNNRISVKQLSIKSTDYAIDVVIDQVEVSGTITDENGEPLPGASIIEKGTTRGAVTDLQGKFNLTVAEDAILTVSFVGYQPQEIALNGRSSLEISLVSDVTALGEIVVVGYGTQTKGTVTSAISSVSGETVEEVPTQTITAALQGKTTGVRVNQSNGSPGQQLDIRIRGGSSITQSNDPLYIVDGLQRDINDINVQDIETLTVLKDAAATAIYGARASNGVVLITTKRGSAGSAQFDLHVSTGFQDFPRKLDKLTARQYIELYRPAGGSSAGQLNGNQSALGTGFDLTSNEPQNSYSLTILPSGQPVPAGYQSIEDPLNPGQTLIFQDNDWQDVLFRTAPITNTYLSVNGGADKIKYAAGVGHTDQEGVAVGSDYVRTSGRVNVDFKVNDWISFRTSSDFSVSKTNQLDAEVSRTFGRSPHVGRTIKTTLPDGSITPGREQASINPELLADLSTNLDQRTTATVALGGTINIIDGLKFDVNGNYHINNLDRDNYDNSWTKESTTFYGNRPISMRQIDQTRTQFEALLTYEKSFNEAHNLSLSAGYTNLYVQGGNAFVAAQNRPANNITTITGAEVTNAFDNYFDRRLVSQFGRLVYNYQFKYLFSGAIRRDGSSVFGSDNQYGIFPSLSLGWVLSEESFFKDLGISNVLSNIKFRGSWGVTGNDNVNNVYGWQGTYSPGFTYAGTSVVYPAEIPNTGLKWEQTTQIDFGLELGLFDQDKIFLTLDVFSKQTDDLLFNVSLPRETGFSSILKNVGSVRYDGYEIGVNARILDKSDFKWNLGVNYSYVIDEVVKLPEGSFDKNRLQDANVFSNPVGPSIRGATFVIYNEEGSPGIGGIAEGERIGNLLGYLPDYIIDTDQQLADYLALNIDDRADANNYVKQKGDVVWVDRNNDGVIDNNDQVVIGNSVPTAFGGITNTFKYKGFDLTVFMDFTLGHMIVDQNRAWLNGNGNRFASPTTDVLRAWTKPGDELPRIAFHDASQGMNYMRLSPINAYKGDFLCLRDVRLGYTFSNAALEAMGGFLSSLRLYVAGNNIHYFTEYPGYNPETGGYTISDRSNYPAFRSFVFGVKVGF